MQHEIIKLLKKILEMFALNSNARYNLIEFLVYKT